MYEELVKDLRYCASSEHGCVECPHVIETCCENMLLMQVAGVIDELSKSCWVPVTERLPECEQGAEVGNIEWISYGMIFAGCFGRGGKYRDAYFRTWTDGTEGIDAKDADYWRLIQIPKPLKEKTE